MGNGKTITHGFVSRLWRSVALSCKDLKVAITRGEYECVADFISLNAQARGIDCIDPFPNMVAPLKPDLIILKDNVELGAAEHGKFDVIHLSFKEVYGRRLKLPKVMQSMLIRVCKETDSQRPPLALCIAEIIYNFLSWIHEMDIFNVSSARSSSKLQMI